MIQAPNKIATYRIPQHASAPSVSARTSRIRTARLLGRCQRYTARGFNLRDQRRKRQWWQCQSLLHVPVSCFCIVSMQSLYADSHGAPSEIANVMSTNHLPRLRARSSVIRQALSCVKQDIFARITCFYCQGGCQGKARNESPMGPRCRFYNSEQSQINC